VDNDKIGDIAKMVREITAKGDQAQEKKTHEFFVDKKSITYISIAGGIFFMLLFFLLSVVLSKYIEDFSMIVRLALYGLLIKVIYDLNKKKRVLVEVFDNSIKVAENMPIAGKASYANFMFKIIKNKIPLHKIPLSNITSIDYKESLFSGYVIIINGQSNDGKSFSFPSAISQLNKEDFFGLMDLLKSKGVGPINTGLK